jgi:Domain of unknown function (DUF397)
MDGLKSLWRKSQYSGANGGGCIEVAVDQGGHVLIRDTTNREGGMLRLTPTAFAELREIAKKHQPR